MLSFSGKLHKFLKKLQNHTHSVLSCRQFAQCSITIKNNNTKQKWLYYFQWKDFSNFPGPLNIEKNSLLTCLNPTTKDYP